MLVVFLVATFFYVTEECQFLPPSQDQKVVQCVLNVLDKYFSEETELTYVSSHPYEDEVLKTIHATVNFSLISRQPSEKMFNYNTQYLVFSVSVADFIEYFEFLIKEPAWNPYARFFIIIKSLETKQLKLVFDVLLRVHVNNVLVMNGTDDAHLYTYNPFDNYACGKYYETIISYGLCLETTSNLYPDKLVTGLRKCNFTASVIHRPPFTLNPLETEDQKTLLGTEEYIITLLAETEQFTVNFRYSDDTEQFSTVAPNMTAIGPMAMLQKNECDIMFGGIIMIATTAEAFTFLCGYHDYSDEILFAIKSSPIVPTWKYIYLEFEPDVWAYILMTLITYWIIVVILLHSKDWGKILLWLLDNLLLHGRDIRTRLTVKYVLITWVWFAYLINTFYQSCLFSLTTHPSVDYQMLNEEDIVKYDLKPCFSQSIRKYLLTETTDLTKSIYFNNEGCETTDEAMDTVSISEDVFTLVANYFYLYNERKYSDKWGDPLVYCFEKPYAKLLFGYFFYKGFPISKRLKLNTLRMRESGLADKSLQDHYYARNLKQKFFKKGFVIRFLFPWAIYVAGMIIAIITFIIELLIKYYN